MGFSDEMTKLLDEIKKKQKKVDGTEAKSPYSSQINGSKDFSEAPGFNSYRDFLRGNDEDDDIAPVKDRDYDTLIRERDEAVASKSLSKFLSGLSENEWNTIRQDDTKGKKEGGRSGSFSKEALEEKKKEEKENRTWFKGSGAFEDGYQFGDVISSINGTYRDMKKSLQAGLIGIAEGAIDTGATLIGGAGKLLGADKFADTMSGFVAKDIINERKVAEKLLGAIEPMYGIWTEKEADNDSVLGDKTDSLIESGGQLGGQIILQAFGVPWFVTSATTSFGKGAEEAFKEDASYGEAVGSAAISAGAEILTEKLFGGSGLGEKGLINVDLFTSKVANKTVKALMDYGIDVVGEGAEEVVSSIFSRLGTKLYKEENIEELLLSEEAFDEYLESFIGGSVLGGGMNVGKAGSSIQSGRDYRSGLTSDEEAVIDKEVEKRIAEQEKDGKKLSNSEKKKITEAVKEDLDKGYISIDTIEEVLGGDSYKSYRETVESEDALKSEFEELETTSERSFLERKYKDEAYEIARGSRLESSYFERARRGEAFTADVTKYDDKQRETVQRAIDAGFLNNTNRTHDLVDMIAKISADKGVSFDFLNNEKLKESGFAVDGKFVNGYFDKKSGTVGINLNSQKSINTIVGHEITHVLEGTEVYNELQNALISYAKAKGDYQGRIDELNKLYDPQDINSELTADLVGDYLFTDADFINRLSTEHRNVFQKVFDEIKYLCKVATTGSKEARELEKVKRVFEKAYQAQKNTAQDGGTKFALSKDTDGKVFVDVTEDIFDTNNGESVARTIQKVISERFNNLIDVHGQKIQINKTTNDEFRRSESVNHLLNSPSQAYDDKLKTIANADEILSAAKNWIGEEIKHVRKDDIVEFARGNVMYRVGENGYVADVIVGTRKNGAAVLYDLVNIYDKKITEAPVTMASNDNSQRRQDASAKGIIPQNQKKSSGNEKFSLDSDIETAGSKEARQLEKVKKTFEDAFRAETKNTAHEGGVKYAISPTFEAEYDAWDKTSKGGYFKLGSTSQALESIGINPSDIYWDKSKIIKIKQDHPEMTDDIIKQIPYLLEYPVMVMQSQTAVNRVVAFGEVYADGNPVLCALELKPDGNITNFIKVASAYSKKGAQNLINTSDILYLDPNKNRTDNWLSALRLQLPAGVTNYGSIGSVTYTNKNVKGEIVFGNDTNTKSAIQEALERAGYTVDQNGQIQYMPKNQKNSLSAQNDDLGPVGDYNVYGKDVALEGPLPDDFAPIAETPNSRTSVDSENENVNRADAEGATALTTEKAVLTESEQQEGEIVTEFITAVSQMIDSSKKSKRKRRVGYVSKTHSSAVNKLMQTINPEFSADGYELWIDGASADHIERRHGKYGKADNSMASDESKMLIPWAAQNAENSAFIRDNAGNIKLSDRFYNSDGSRAPEIRLEKVINGDIVYVSECVPDSTNKRIWITSAYIKRGSKGQLLNMEETSPQPTPEAFFDSNATNNIIAPEPNSVNTSAKTTGDADSDDLGPTGDYNAYGRDVALEDSLPDDFAPIAETANSRTSVDSGNGNVNRVDTLSKEYISFEDFANTDSSVWRNVEYNDIATKSAIMQEVHDAMVKDGSVIQVSENVTSRVEESFPDIRGMKKKERTPILKEAINKLKSNLRQFLNGFKNQTFEFEVDGKVLEAKLYNTGINEVLEKITQDKASMLYTTEEIFGNARYLYSTPDYDGDPNVYRWNYFYTPVQIGSETVGVRIAVRDTANPAESHIYNWNIKKDASLGGERDDSNNRYPSGASSDASIDTSLDGEGRGKNSRISHGVSSDVSDNIIAPEPNSVNTSAKTTGDADSDDLGPTGDYNAYGGDVALEDSLPDDFAPIAETANSRTSVDSENRKIINKLTGREIAPNTYIVLDRLSKGEAISAREIEALKEVKEGEQKAIELLSSFIAEHPEFSGITQNDVGTYLINDADRIRLNNEIINKRLNEGSFTGIDENGNEVYNGEVKRDRRLDVVIGLPASGKSSSIVNPLSQFYHSAVIDSDIIKSKLPEYNDGWGSSLVHEESKRINTYLLGRSMDLGNNIVLPIVGSKVDSVEKYIELAKEHGYKINIHLNELSNGKATGRVLKRYFDTGRFINPAITAECGNAPTEVYEQIKQRGDISGYSRWNNDVPKGQRPALVEISENNKLYGSYSGTWGRGGQSGIGRADSKGTSRKTEKNNEIAPLGKASSEDGVFFDGETIVDDLGPIGDYNVYGGDVALEGSLPDDFAPIAETANSRTSVDSDNGNVNRVDAEGATALSTESITDLETVTYSKEEADSILKDAKNQIATSYNDVLSFITSAKNGTQPKRLFLGKIKTAIANKIKSMTKVNADGKSVVLSSDDIRHIFKQHGDAQSEALRGQEAITTENFSTVLDAIFNPDSASASTDASGVTSIVFKKDNGNKITAVTIVSEKKKALTLKSAMIIKKGQHISPPSDVQAPNQTPKSELSMNAIPTDSISETQANVNSAGENKVLSVRELYEQKLSNHKNALNALETDKSNSLSSFDEAIRKKLNEYNCLKDKNTKRANTLLQQIENLRLRRDNVQADYANRIAKQQSRIEAFESKSFEEFEQKELAIRRRDNHKRIIDGIKARFTEQGYDLDEVFDKAKNLSTFATVDNTPQRVMEKSLGYKEGQILSDLTVDQVARNESEGIKWLNSVTNNKDGLLAQLVRKYGIKPGSKASAVAQMYAEGFFVDTNGDVIKYGNEELAKDFPNEQVRLNIIGLARDQRVRQFYDETLDKINESRVRNAYPEIQKLDNYFLHFRAMEDTFSRLGLPFNPNDIKAKDLPTDLNGVTADLKPGQPYFASARHRKGIRTSYDLLGGLERYASSAKNQIYHIDDIQTLRAIRNYIADGYGQAKGLESLDSLTEEEAQEKIKQVYGSHLSTFAKFLNEEANVIAGKTALIDRGLEGIIGRRGITLLDTINKQVGANMVGFNVSSSLTNFIPIAQTFAKANKFDFTKAFAQTASNKINSIFGRSDEFIENNPTILRRRGADRFYQTPYQKVGDIGYTLMGVVDDISTEMIVRTKYNEYTRKGMSEQDAVKAADKWASRLMADRSLGQMPQIYNSRMLGLFTKFQLEVRNQLDAQFYDTIQEAKVSNEDIENGLLRNAKTAAKVTSTFAQLAIAQHLYGMAFEAIAGYNPAFDIISVLVTAFGFDDDDEDTVLDNLGQGFLELLEDLPYTSAITGGGRIPISSALPIEDVLTAITGEDANGNEISRKDAWKTVGEAAPYYFMPGGYGQLKKTIKGMKMFDDDLPISGSYTDSGKLRYPVEDTVKNRLQAAIFGQYANENAGEYFDGGHKALDEKQIQEFIDVDIPIQDYWDYREGLSELNKASETGTASLAEKIDYIMSLDLPIEKKNLLANNLTEREEPIDLTGYEQYGNYKEFDFAKKYPEKYAFLQDHNISVSEYENFDEDTKSAYTWASKNPAKYTVSKAISDDLMTYRSYTNALYDIKADKDEDGKSISGSRKEKVIDYINNLDADYGQKIILFKSEYPSDDTYNYEIIDYLNGRDDISYSDMVTILKELGFKVEGDQVYWD